MKLMTQRAAQRDVDAVDQHLLSLEDELAERARDGDVDALLAWGALLEPIEYGELGWGG